MIPKNNSPEKPARPQCELLTLGDCARELNCSMSSAWHLFRPEPGVKLIMIPGRRRPMIRVPRSVLRRVLERSDAARAARKKA